ncbi:Fc receptor-like protein 5 isoform X1 [Puntigrus tetrazona]|uniref:Fc receptor-like protein 5 isoform X1 n=1 Tax=Puntigrus tetrazona TaxID=1606681 RepID=UPI001C8A39A6|nr:Fc receptor-like protein 5 isoform X1 [Puntigrus tetrazona]
MGSSALSLILLLMSFIHAGFTQDSLKLTVTPHTDVFTGETVSLTCEIESDHSDWRYDWCKQEIDRCISESSDRYTVKGNTLTIRGAAESDQGQYWCRRWRDGEPDSVQSSSNVSLSVKDSPKSSLTVTPDSPVFTGERVTLKCVIESYRDWRRRNGLTYDWRNDWTPDWRYEFYKDSVILNTSDHYTVTRDTLTIRGSTESDEGQYWCRGQREERPQSSQSSSDSLFVVERPKPVLKVTPDQSVFRGERVTLRCDIQTENIQWTYSWFKYRYRYYPTTTTTTTTPEYSFTADYVSVSEYRCRGERSDSQRSSNFSDAVKLTVSDSPRSSLTVTPDRTVFTGERVTLKCETESYRDWRWRNGLIYNSGSTWPYEWRYEYKSSSGVVQSYTVNGDTLTIEQSKISDEGDYTCKGNVEGRSVSSESSSVSLKVKDLKPKPELTSDPEGAALTGNTVTLTCLVNLGTGWDFYWNKHTLTSETKTETNSYRVKIDSVSDGGQYRCRAGRGTPVYYTHYSDALWVNVTESPKAVVTVRPDKHVFRGETVTLRCDIKWGGDTEWTYRWEIEGTDWYKDSADRCTKECSSSETDDQKHRNAVSWCSTQDLILSRVEDFHSGIYTCRGQNNTQCSQRSDAVTLKVSAEAQAAVRVSPQPWLTEGDSVTLICEVPGSSTGWTFSWFREDDDDEDDGLSDSSRGAGDSYTLSPAALQHTGVYTCRAERGRPAFYTHNSSTQLLWITGKWSRVSLKVSPSRSQHFSSHSLSLSCEDQRSSSGWTVRRYTDRKTEDCSKQTGSRCRIDSLSTSDTGVYWCQSESGEKHHPLNITVHNGEVILESSVDPLVEGDTLTLRCLHRSTNSSILGADFYKDGSLLQNQTTGEMNITTVSKSHEGFYYCKTQRGESPKSWISVRAASSSLLITGVVLGLLFLILILISLLLLWRFKKNKDQQGNINQTSVLNQAPPEISTLQSGSDQICDVVTEVKKDGPDPLADVTYSEITVKKKKKKKMDKDDSMAEPNNVTYSEVKVKKSKSRDINTAGPSDVIYAQIDLQDKKKTKGKGAGLHDFFIEMKSKDKQRGKSGESGDTVYSELKNNTVGGAEAADATYAQPIKKKKKKKTRV